MECRPPPEFWELNDPFSLSNSVYFMRPSPCTAARFHKGTVAWEFWSLGFFMNQLALDSHPISFSKIIVFFWSNILVMIPTESEISGYHYLEISLSIFTQRFYNLQVTIPGISSKKQLSYKKKFNCGQIQKISGYRYPEISQLPGIDTRKLKISRYCNLEIFNFRVTILRSWEISG